MFDVVRVLEILQDCAGEFGEDDLPLPGTEVIEFWFLVPLKPEKVRAHEQEMIRLLKEWPSEYWGQPVPPLGHEISYTNAAVILGDQTSAFQLFAYGQLLGWWSILDPKSVLGLSREDPLGVHLANSGLITMTGYKPAESD
jgi:hypothetical protein